MALIAHWPLNGNTNDISGFNNNGTPTNVTYTTGKIGQAGSFNGSSSFISITNTYTITNKLSVSAWCFKSSSSGSAAFIGNWQSTGLNDSWLLVSNSTNRMRFYVRSTNNSDFVMLDIALTNDTWEHYTGVFDNGVVSIYKNGVLAQTANANFTTLYQNAQDLWMGRYSSNYLNGRINDVRIYDHALTDFEIQELARAKILHYSFDDFQEPTTNQADTEAARTMFTHTAGTTITHSLAPEKGDGWRKMVITARGSNFRLAQFPYITHPTSTTKTYSVEIDMGLTSGYYWRVDGFTGTGSATIINNRAFVTVTTTTGSGVLALFLNNNTINTTGISDTIFYRYYQVEVKPYMTEFTPTSRTGLVRDHSGFFNDSNALTEANTPRWISDSKVGAGAYQFNGSNTVIERPMLSQLGDNSFTVNMWAWFDDSGVRDVMFGNFDATHDFNFEKLTNNNLRFYWDGSPDVSTGNVIPIGQWCMLTAVRQRLSSTSSTIKMYVNGQSVYNSTLTVNDKTSLNGTLRIGRDFRTTTEAMKGKLDDVKVYMEPLSDKDILDLYNTKAEIEQSGVLYARDFLSNAEATVNLIESIGTVVRSTKVGNGVLINWTSNFGDTYFFFNLRNGLTLTTGDQYTISFDCTGKPDDKTVVFNWANIAGLGITLKNGRNSLTFNVPSDTRAFLDDSVRDNTINNLYLYNFQLERKDHPTPFVSTFRPTIELPTGVQFGADEIHETGITNFEDFSTVGISDGLVGYWPLDKNAKDYSGNNNDGTIIGAVNTSGFVDGAYSFNYTNLDRISLSTFNNLNFNQGVTISAFIKSNDITKSQNIVSRNGPYFLRITGSTIRCAILSGTWIFVNGTIPLQSNTWYHLVLTYDQVKVKGYVNGVLDVNADKTGVLNSSASHLFIGYTTAVGEQSAFDGIIDEVKIFNRALTAEEIQIEYNTMFNNEVQIHKNGTLYAKNIIQY
jgi:hypothetical protein